MSDIRFDLMDGTWDNSFLIETEVLELLKFLTEHVSCRALLTFAFSTDSGIGQNVVVECGCGIQKNLTDYESW